jgi:translation initiation factor 1
LTTVQGLPDKYDPKKLLKAMKKEFACNGHVVASAEDSDEESPAPQAKGADFGRVLQFQGDQRTKVKDWLVAAGLVSEKEAKEQIVV